MTKSMKVEYDNDEVLGMGGEHTVVYTLPKCPKCKAYPTYNINPCPFCGQELEYPEGVEVDIGAQEKET